MTEGESAETMRRGKHERGATAERGVHAGGGTGCEGAHAARLQAPASDARSLAPQHEIHCQAPHHQEGEQHHAISNRIALGRRVLKQSQGGLQAACRVVRWGGDWVPRSRRPALDAVHAGALNLQRRTTHSSMGAQLGSVSGLEGLLSMQASPAAGSVLRQR